MTEILEIKDVKVHFQSQLQCQYCEVIITIRAIVAYILFERRTPEPINRRKVLS